jgi:hypothetical protein
MKAAEIRLYMGGFQKLWDRSFIPLPVDNSLKTVDKPAYLGKTRPFVRIIQWGETPIYGGGFQALAIYRNWRVGWENLQNCKISSPGRLGKTISSSFRVPDVQVRAAPISEGKNSPGSRSPHIHRHYYNYDIHIQLLIMRLMDSFILDNLSGIFSVRGL